MGLGGLKHDGNLERFFIYVADVTFQMPASCQRCTDMVRIQLEMPHLVRSEMSVAGKMQISERATEVDLRQADLPSCRDDLNRTLCA